MSQIVDFLHEAKVFYLATVGTDSPHIRPFSAVIAFENKICFCTNNQKAIYQQLIANPRTEISAMADGSWIRLSGNAVFVDNEEIKKAMLTEYPALNELYTVGDGLFEIFYLENISATIFKGPEQKILLD